MDLLSHRITSIRNGQKTSRRHVVCRIANRVGISREVGFNVLVSSLKLLRREGFIRGFSFSDINGKQGALSKDSGLYIVVYLKYDAHGNSAIRSIFRTSKPGRRVYISARSL